MADYCNKCTSELFHETVEPDIDVYKLFEECKSRGEDGYIPVLCEGCGLCAVGYRHDSGTMVVKRITTWPNVSEWENY